MTLPRIFRTTAFRFALLYAALFAGSVGLLGVIVYHSTRAALEARAQEQVDDEARGLVAEYKARGMERLMLVVTARMQGRQRDALEYSLTVRDALLAGRSIPVAESSGVVAIPSRGEGPNDLRPADARSQARAGDGNRRAYFRAVQLDNGARLVVADDLDWIDAVQEAILKAFGWALAATALLALAGGALLSARFLARLDAMTRTASAIVAGDLSSRIPQAGGDDEFDRLARAFNAMLDRLAALMESLRQVSSDIAHDLRTPLARLRQSLDEASRSSTSLADMQTRVALANEQVEEILSTFAALLRIAQIEAGQRRAGFADLDLSALVAGVAEDWRAVAEEKRQTLTSAIESDVAMSGDRELLVQMLVNLVENAIRHTPEGTRIVVSLKREAAATTLAVADDGPGVPADERDKIFRRFYRTERSRTTPGGGLGLAMAAAIADLHGAGVAALDNAPGLRVEVRFPVAEMRRHIGKP
ncbi:MAG: HAMP domain-containing histidine kinase [Rhizobiales bacterium]|nr:HAMP domain-containing histidine kinase [Hyphomicrobiales bacterium]